VIAGVPGSGAPILLDFLDSGGAVTGCLLPTGQARESLELDDGRELTISIVDAANPCVFALAEQLGVPGTLLPTQIATDPTLLHSLEEIRGRAAQRIGLVEDWRDATRHSPSVPKMIMVSGAEPYQCADGRSVQTHELDLVARAMSMQKPHKAYPITGTICTGAAALTEGTVVHGIVGQQALPILRIGHPSGVINVDVSLEHTGEGLCIRRAVVERTARRLMSGHAYVPASEL
jgi:2-methylaconitate cis-trans-isomerase PrpF